MSARKWSQASTYEYLNLYLDAIKKYGIGEGGKLKSGTRAHMAEALTAKYPEFQWSLNDLKMKFWSLQREYQKMWKRGIRTSTAEFPYFDHLQRIVDVKEQLLGLRK